VRYKMNVGKVFGPTCQICRGRGSRTLEHSATLGGEMLRDLVYFKLRLPQLGIFVFRVRGISDQQQRLGYARVAPGSSR